jgi:hypothetical protein
MYGIDWTGWRRFLANMTIYMVQMVQIEVNAKVDLHAVWAVVLVACTLVTLDSSNQQNPC